MKVTFEEAIEADRGTALKAYGVQDLRLAKARQVTAHVLAFMQPYIRENAYQEAYDAFLRTAYESEVEMVSRTQIMEFERYRQMILDGELLRVRAEPIRVQP